MRLGEQALARGQLELAETRFRRVLSLRPDAPRARLGLARVALRQGRPEAAEPELRWLLDHGHDDADVRLCLAEVARSAGDGSGARAHLEAALRFEPGRAEAHQSLFELTGPAPRDGLDRAPVVLRLAETHPYDPRVQVRAALVLERRDRERAIEHLERAVWLADLDPASANAAIPLLQRLSPMWRSVRFVPVHAFADEVLREDPSWRFRQRSLWAEVSVNLSGILHVRFVPYTLGAIVSGSDSVYLDDLHRSFRGQIDGGATARGIVASFTGREPPPLGLRRLGLAEYLRRRITVRVTPGLPASRTLAHELLHLYGAIHVAQEVPSLMNPAGAEFQLDPPNARLERALRRREFFDGPLAQTVLPFVDLSETIDAYDAALRQNLYFRRLGYDRLREAQVPRRIARAEVEQLRREDPLMAQVAHMVARLMLQADRKVEALVLLETAATLYGPETPRGRRVAEQARRLEAYLTRTLQP